MKRRKGMYYPKSKDEELSNELFEQPTSEYRATPFWAWNCKLEPKNYAAR